jgi:hypothetical protein
LYRFDRAPSSIPTASFRYITRFLVRRLSLRRRSRSLPDRSGDRGRQSQGAIARRVGIPASPGRRSACDQGLGDTLHASYERSGLTGPDAVSNALAVRCLPTSRSAPEPGRAGRLACCGPRRVFACCSGGV